MSRREVNRPFTLVRDALGHLVLTDADGVVHVAIVPVRAFALSAPDLDIALLSAEGKELQWLETLDELPSATRELIHEELASREFMPEIERILAVSSYATPSTWQVTTDRGDTTLLLRSEDDIRRLKGPGALLIGDSQGIHYLIRDRRQLDAHSQKILKRFL